MRVGTLTLEKETFLSLYMRTNDYASKERFGARDIKAYIERNILPDLLFAAEGFARDLDRSENVLQLFEREKKRILTEPNGILYRSIIPEEFEVSEKELRKLYETQSTQVKFAHIWLYSGALADSLYTLLENGADFTALAKMFSAEVATSFNGGVRNQFYTEGLFPEPIEKALYDLPVGGHSRPIELEFGYHLVKLLEKRQVEPQPFDQMKENLRRRMTVLANNELVEEFISKLVTRKGMRINTGLIPSLSRMYLRDHETDERKLDAARVPEVNLEETLVSWKGGEWKLREMIEYYNTTNRNNRIPLYRAEDVAAIARNALLNDFMYAHALRKGMDKTAEFKRYYSQLRRQIVARECRKITINEEISVSEEEIRREYERSEDLRAQEYDKVRNSIEDILLRQKSVAFAGTVIRQLRERYPVEFNDELISETAAGLEKI